MATGELIGPGLMVTIVRLQLTLNERRKAMPNDERSMMEMLRDSLKNFAETGDGNFTSYPDSVEKRAISAAVGAYLLRTAHPPEFEGEEIAITFRHAPGSKGSEEPVFTLSQVNQVDLLEGSAEYISWALLGALPVDAPGEGGDKNEPSTKEEGGGEEEITEQDIADTMPPPAGE